jgi:hypothetical protein
LGGHRHTKAHDNPASHMEQYQRVLRCIMAKQRKDD